MRFDQQQIKRYLKFALDDVERSVWDGRSPLPVEYLSSCFGGLTLALRVFAAYQKGLSVNEVERYYKKVEDIIAMTRDELHEPGLEDTLKKASDILQSYDADPRNIYTEPQIIIRPSEGKRLVGDMKRIVRKIAKIINKNI